MTFPRKKSVEKFNSCEKNWTDPIFKNLFKDELVNSVGKILSIEFI